MPSSYSRRMRKRLSVAGWINVGLITIEIGFVALLANWLVPAIGRDLLHLAFYPTLFVITAHWAVAASFVLVVGLIVAIASPPSQGRREAIAASTAFVGFVVVAFVVVAITLPFLTKISVLQ